MAAPAAVPAAAAGIVGIFASASVVVGRLAGATEVNATSTLFRNRGIIALRGVYGWKSMLMTL